MANRSSRNPGQLANFDATGNISPEVPAYAVDTGQASRALAEVAGGLSTKLGQLADRARKREGQMDGLGAGRQSSESYLNHQAVVGEASGVAGTGPWHEQAKAILRKEEGFKDKPYWDSTAYRTGYGSDTTVTADGKVVKVTQGMAITREDAERDLDYRIEQREGAAVRKQLGATWDKLSDNARAGLVSVGYNYGSLPGPVVAAARTGDVNAIADAVAGLGSNKARRQREAAIIRSGGSTAAAPSGTPDGLVDAGNIDLAKRPVVKNEDGSISTVRSMSFEEDSNEVLVPTVSPDGKLLSNDDAIALYRQTGQHLGKFKTADAATAYAQNLHKAQEKFYTQRESKGQAAAGAAVPQLSDTPLALRRDGTIYGEAFDDAALSSWGWRMQEGVSTDLLAAQLNNPDDPQAFQAAAAEIRDRYQKELPADPEAQEMFERSFAQRTEAYGRSVATQHEARLKEDQKTSYAAGVSAKTIDLERQAQVLGANPDGDRIIGQQVTEMQRSIDGAVQQGILSPAQAEEKKKDVALRAATGRVQGVFEALPTIDAKEQFSTNLLRDWKEQKGPLAALPFSVVKGMSDQYFNEAQRLKALEKAGNGAEQSRVKSLVEDDVASMATTGRGVEDLTRDQVSTTLGPDKARAWSEARDQAQRVYQATAGMEASNGDEIDERVASLAPRPGQSGYADQQKIFEAAAKRGEMVLKERAKDPLGQAAGAGIIDLQPIDTSSPDAISQSLVARNKQRSAVADAYGFMPPLFTPEEDKALKAQMLSMDPAIQTGVMTQLDYLSGVDGPLSVKQHFGDDAVSRLQDWQARLRYMTPDEMSAWLKEKGDPRWQERVKPLVDKGEREARKVSADDVVKALDENSIFDVNGPADPDTRRMMMDDYASLVGDRFASTQDLASAKSQAVDRMRKIWGGSSAFDERGGRLMLYPPEQHYPAVASSHRYITDELQEIAGARGVPLQSLSLVSDRKTEAAVDRGELPGYLVSVIDPKTGNDDLLTDDKGRALRHFFDPKAAQTKVLDAATEERRTRNDPWLVLPGGNAIGPIYPFGAGKADLEERARRIREIPAEQKKRFDDYQKKIQELPWEGIDN